MIKLGILDLVTDSNGKLSATKLWLHIANIVMSKTMLDSKIVDWELLAAYGSIVGGSYVATVFLKRKYPNDVLDEQSKDSPLRKPRAGRSVRATQHGDDVGGGE